MGSQYPVKILQPSEDKHEFRPEAQLYRSSRRHVKNSMDAKSPFSVYAESQCRTRKLGELGTQSGLPLKIACLGLIARHATARNFDHPLTRE